MDSSITRILVPRTDFVHVDTGEGLLDLLFYGKRRGFIEFKLGAGLTFVVPSSVLDRAKILSWEGFSFRAGPPEFAFLPKAVLYPRLKRSPETLDEEGAKHLEDLKRLAQIIDWDFAAALLDQLQVHWLGRPIPRAFDRRFNPFRAVDLNQLRDELF
jgi:hypothetical protein